MPLHPHPSIAQADALKINMLLRDGLNHLSEIQREIIQSVFGVFGTERIKAFKRHFRLAHQLRSREVDEQLALAISHLQRYLKARNIQASDIEFE